MYYLDIIKKVSTLIRFVILNIELEEIQNNFPYNKINIINNLKTFNENITEKLLNSEYCNLSVFYYATISVHILSITYKIYIDKILYCVSGESWVYACEYLLANYVSPNKSVIKISIEYYELKTKHILPNIFKYYDL